jgi:hypothetical protein
MFCLFNTPKRERNSAQGGTQRNPIPPQVQLEKTCNAAADHYCHPALSFRDRFGKRTVERLPLTLGWRSSRLLWYERFCIASGGTCRAKGSGGRCESCAKSLGQRSQVRCGTRFDNLTNIEFRGGDLERLPDAVICAFGIFFVPDLELESATRYRLSQPLWPRQPS